MSDQAEAGETLKDKRKRWFYRRVAYFGQQGAFTLMLGYTVVMGDGANMVHQMAMQALPLAMVAGLMAYIGGPIADDWLQHIKITRS